jgi:hypothetical protein
LVPGFQPDGGTVATLMGREGRGGGRRSEGPRDSTPRPMAPRPAAPRPQRPQGDPIFSRPYEPSAASTAPAPKAEESPQQSKRRQPQVAALLGGLKRA